jgi:hypothetical protein
MRVKNWLKRNKTVRSTTAYNSAKSIGVVFCIKDKSLPNFESFIHKLQNDNKQVTILAYFQDKKENYTHKYDCFTSENISFWGSYKDDQIINFVGQPFDYLFHLDDSQSTVIQGILAQSHAKCRIGKYSEQSNPFYELMINTDQEDYLQEMYNYTTILN